MFDIISYDDVSPKVKTSVTSDDDSYDIVLDGISNTVVYSANGYLYELSTFPNLDITAPWWNKKIMSDMSIFDKYYVGINDMTIQAYYSAGIVYFNKNMAQEYDIEDPYELVRSGKWTFDKLCELCRNVSKDLDGDGQLTEKDQYGITYNNFAWQILYYGINEPFIKKDNDGELYFDSKNEKIINYLQKMFLPRRTTRLRSIPRSIRSSAETTVLTSARAPSMRGARCSGLRLCTGFRSSGIWATISVFSRRRSTMRSRKAIRRSYILSMAPVCQYR